MTFSPSSTVRLLHVPFDITQKNQLTFADADAQTDYFMAQKKHEYTGVVYIKKDNCIRIPAHIDTLYDSNYVMYQNPILPGKWFYAFIADMQYISDNLTFVYIKTDVYQTWLFDITFKKSFVVREHVSDDSIGKNIQDEGLETGPYIYNDWGGSITEMGLPVVILATTVVKDGTGLVPVTGDAYDSVFSGVAYIPYDSGHYSDLLSFLADVTAAGKQDAITCMFMFPGGLLGTFTSGTPIKADSPVVLHTLAKHLSSINGYTPHNNKLFCSPYNLLYVSNQMGQKAELPYEFFSTSDCEFNIQANLAPNPVVYCIPLNFKGVAENYEESLTVSGWPLCNWTYDAFKSWLAQNSVSLAIGAASSVIGIAAGAATGNALGVASGVIGVAQEIGQVHQHAIQPPQAKGNTTNGGAAFSMGMLVFSFYSASITADYAQHIDSFFDMYGYKVDTLKVPNLTGRPKWNYVKTIDANIEGNLPMADLAELKTIFNNGVTLWHDAATMYDYSQTNK